MSCWWWASQVAIGAVLVWVRFRLGSQSWREFGPAILAFGIAVSLALSAAHVALRGRVWGALILSAAALGALVATHLSVRLWARRERLRQEALKPPDATQ